MTLTVDTNPQLTTGQKVKRLRENAGLTQKEYAGLANISQGYLSQIETDDIDSPSLSTLKALANAVGVSYTYFEPDAPVDIMIGVHPLLAARLREMPMHKQALLLTFIDGWNG